MRYTTREMKARVSRVVCLSQYDVPGCIGSWAVQQIVASISVPAEGRFIGRTSMSPRLMSSSSVVVIETESPADASAWGPSNVSMEATVVCWRDGRTRTSSPGRIAPDATRPA